MMNLGFFSPLLPSVDAIMGRLPACRTPVRPPQSLSLGVVGPYAYVLVSFACPGWSGVGVLLYETRGRFPPR
jgi:hypothetical protein